MGNGSIGYGKDDIWRARVRDGHWDVDNLGPGINTAENQSEFLPSPDGLRPDGLRPDGLWPDGLWGIISTDRGLVRAVSTDHGWRRDRAFPDQNGTEIGPLFAADAHSFMFSRDAADGAAGELYIARLSPGVGWTPKCPVTR